METLPKSSDLEPKEYWEDCGLCGGWGYYDIDDPDNDDTNDPCPECDGNGGWWIHPPPPQ